MTEKTYKYLLFDADNTLFDFDRSEKQALAETFAGFGAAISEAEIEAYHRINDALWKKLERGETTREKLKVQRFAEFIEYLGASEIDAFAAAAAYVERLSEQCFLIDGALGLCEHLSRKYPLYLITNGITTVQKKRFAKSPIKKFFKNVYISEEMGATKPDERYFRLVAGDIGDGDPENYLVIGDSLSSDIQGAVNFGCDSVWIAPEGKTDPRPTYTVRGFSEIYEILL